MSETSCIIAVYNHDAKNYQIAQDSMRKYFIENEIAKPRDEDGALSPGKMAWKLFFSRRPGWLSNYDFDEAIFTNIFFDHDDRMFFDEDDGTDSDQSFAVCSRCDNEIGPICRSLIYNYYVLGKEAHCPKCDKILNITPEPRARLEISTIYMPDMADEMEEVSEISSKVLGVLSKQLNIRLYSLMRSMT